MNHAEYFYVLHSCPIYIQLLHYFQNRIYNSGFNMLRDITMHDKSLLPESLLSKFKLFGSSDKLDEQRIKSMTLGFSE